MRFFSFVQNGLVLSPVEVQISLLPGLPEVKFSGLVNTAIKESSTRIKSAFKRCGYEWPTRKQIIINISPACIKKNSLGMDLALACALLWKTGQADFSFFGKEGLYVYGEVGLGGEISCPENLHLLPIGDFPLLTGKIKSQNFRKNTYSISDLQEVSSPKKANIDSWQEYIKKPKLPETFFSESASFVMKLCAVGEHNALFCGEAGSGKTTLVENLYHLLAPPKQKFWQELRQIDRPTKWRPLIAPHHTTTPLSMIGGGVPLFPGEISKAHGGQLVMDEYLEFHPKVQEALREPLEKGRIRLVRRGLSLEFPARFLLTATTNLCPCGDFEPGRPLRCAYSLQKCQSHLDRLSGPMLDRFDMLVFSKDWKGERKVSLKEILEEVKQAQAFQSKRRQYQPNSQLELAELESNIPDFLNKILPNTSSNRRKRALLRLARTYADLKGDISINESHIDKIYSFSVKNFYFLKNRMMTN